MERRGSALDKERHPHMARRSGTPRWQDAVRRGAILGCVLAGHLAILMAVLHPSWQKIEPAVPQHEDRVLRLSFDPLPKISRPLPVRTATRAPARPKSARAGVVPPTIISAARLPTNTPSSTATSLIMTAPAVTDELRRSTSPASSRRPCKTRSERGPTTSLARLLRGSAASSFRPVPTSRGLCIALLKSAAVPTSNSNCRTVPSISHRK